MSVRFDDIRALCDAASDHMDEWQGFPVPVEGAPLRLHARHPLREKMARFYDPDPPEAAPTPADAEPRSTCVNSWTSRSRQSRVFVMRSPDGRAYALREPLPPDGAMDRLTLWLTTLGAADGWTVEAEAKARRKLKGMLRPRQWEQYELTGTFLETSERSRLTYLLRRCRPTVALTPRWKDRDGRETPDTIRCLAVLCLHPVGFYDRTWAGCLTPTDDVIAHLLMIRADEADYWGQANQHDPAAPEAGI